MMLLILKRGMATMNGIVEIKVIENKISEKLNEMKTRSQNPIKLEYKPYDYKLHIVRKEYGFNLLPTRLTTRDFTSESSLPNLSLDLICYYTLDSEEVRSESYPKFLDVLDELRTYFLRRNNIPNPLNTVKVDINFNDDLLEVKTRNRVLNCIMQFTYRMYAIR